MPLFASARFHVSKTYFFGALTTNEKVTLGSSGTFNFVSSKVLGYTDWGGTSAQACNLVHHTGRACRAGS